MPDNEARITALSSFMRSPLVRGNIQRVEVFLGEILKEGDVLNSPVFPYVFEAKRWMAHLEVMPAEKMTGLLSSPYYEGLSSCLQQAQVIEPARLCEHDRMRELVVRVAQLFKEQIQYPTYLDLLVVKQAAVYKYVPALDRFLHIMTLAEHQAREPGSLFILPVLSVLRSLYIAHEAGYQQGLILLGWVWAFITSTAMQCGLQVDVKWGTGEVLLNVEDDPFWCAPIGFEVQTVPAVMVAPQPTVEAELKPESNGVINGENARSL